MKRQGRLAAAVLCLVPLVSACGLSDPPPTGTIQGQVQIEGEGIDGLTVTLSEGRTTVTTAVTANGGNFRFDDVEAGTYTAMITDVPSDATFGENAIPATISMEGDVVTMLFRGAYIRTSRVAGTVTVTGEGLGSVTVTLSGTSESETLTDVDGDYDFPGLRAGTYTVAISGFDTERITFDNTAATATVAVGESRTVTFEGRYLRNSTIAGRVSVEEDPLPGVTVSIEGEGESRSATTDSAGEYRFSQLFSGTYAITISDFDPDEYVFNGTSLTVTVARDETAGADFAGTFLRTSAITGQVTADNNPLPEVTVSLDGRGEEYAVTTNSAGQFTFSDLRSGDYVVGITNPNEDEYGFEVTSRTVSVADGETSIVPFQGILLRTAAIMGTVTIEGTGLEDVTVSISGGGERHEILTNAAGQYSFTRLHAGEYSIGISGFDDDFFGFEVTTTTVTIGLEETAIVPFTGILLRSAVIQGTVTVEGDALPGVTVMISGGPKDEEHVRLTDDAGHFSIANLHAGEYSVSISDFDVNEYGFEADRAVRHG